MQAFEGIRVLDFTQVLAGPFAVMQLALLGAEVIKLEHPETGDQTRGLMNAGEDIGMSPSFLGMNLNKRSLAVDLKHPEGKALVLQLVAGADVVVENFKAGTMASLGLGYETLKAIKPDLIYCAISGYGQTGPRAGQAAYDGAIQASSGMMSQTGYPETGPTRTGYMPVDMGTALNSAFVISSALLRRERTGEGQYLDVAMLDTAICMQAAQFSNWFNQGTLVGLMGNASPTRQPTANVFRTADGHLQVTALRQPQVEKLFRELGIEALLEDARYATPKSRIEHAPEIHRRVADLIKERGTAHWMKQLAKLGIPVAEVRSLPEVAADPLLEERDVFASLPPLADGSDPVKVVKAGYVAGQDGARVRSPAPVLGQHSREILAELGCREADITRLAEAGVVYLGKP